MKRRIFIESDILHEDELNSVRRRVYFLLEKIGEPFIEDIFDEALDRAWHDTEKTWKAVKKADEIYADSSLMPLVGNSYMGAPVIFNEMMKKAIAEDVRGKSVFILRDFKSIDWYMIDIKNIKKAFKYNKLFCYDDEHDNLIPIDLKKIKK